MFGLRGWCSALWRRWYISGEAELMREHRGGVGRVTIGVEDIGGGARRRGGCSTARSWRVVTGRLVAAVVVRDGLLGRWVFFVGEGGPCGGRWRHKARDCVNDAVRGGGGHGGAD